LRAFRAVLNRIERWQPLRLRRLFRIEKQINPKALGLLAAGYLNLYEITGEGSFKEKAIECLEWLKKNPSDGFRGICWGYPFDWLSKRFIPKGTPSAVVSGIIGHAFWAAYKIFRKEQYLNICEQICEFFITNLNISWIDNNCICFSYTPLDDFHIHNANLFVAEYLLRVGMELNRNDLLNFGHLAANYALKEQNPDGSIFYWGAVQNHFNPNHMDHYHSGFEMRMLYNIGQTTEDKRFKVALKRYYRYYLKNMMHPDNGYMIPKLNPKHLYPIDIHACAEAILCNSTLAHEFREAQKLLPYLSLWVIKKMQTPQGWFRYTILKTPIGEYSANIPYLRWGQAWMLVALSTYLKTITNEIQNRSKQTCTWNDL